MNKSSYTTNFSVDKTPEEIFAAINNARGWWAGWWSGKIEGDTNKLGAEFTYNVKDVHYSKQKITEFVPGKKVVWRVEDASLSFVKNKSEWIGTDIVFEIAKKSGKTEVRFTHSGLLPAFECYNNCSDAWGMLINDSLRNLIITGKEDSKRK